MSKLKFLWKKYRGELITVILASIIAPLWVYETNRDILDFANMDSWYGKWLDPIVTVATFLVASFVWYDNKVREWENSLPKSLTVHYKWGNQYVMSAYNLKLLSEEDIRAFAQSIGSQINDTDRLKFIPGITEREPQNIHTKSSGFIRYYEVEMYLTEPPKGVNNQYVVWELEKTPDQIIPTLKEGENDYVVTDKGKVYKRERRAVGTFRDTPYEYDLRNS